MDNFDDVGWEGLDFVDKMEAIDDQKTTDSLFAKVFNTPEGKMVLAELRSRTLDAPSWYPGANEHFGYVREGQNTVVREILTRIDRAKRN